MLNRIEICIFYIALYISLHYVISVFQLYINHLNQTKAPKNIAIFGLFFKNL